MKAKQLLYLRAEHSLLMKDIAKVMGVTRQMIYAIEHRNRPYPKHWPEPEELARLACDGDTYDAP